MIKFIARLTANALFWMGHWVSLIMNNDWLFWLYPLYSRLMTWSCDLSDKYQLGIWRDSTDEYKTTEDSDDSEPTE